MKKKGLIISTIVMVVVLIASLTTATYAWFTTDSKATISSISIATTNASEVQIGLRTEGSAAANLWSKSYAPNASQFRSGQVSFNELAVTGGVNTLGSSIISSLSLAGLTKAIGTAAKTGSGDSATYVVDATTFDLTTSGHVLVAANGSLTTPDNESARDAHANMYTEDSSSVQGDYIDWVIGFMPTLETVDTFTFNITVNPGEKPTLGLLAALHLRYSFDGTTYYDVDLYGSNNSQITLRTAVASPSGQISGSYSAFNNQNAESGTIALAAATTVKTSDSTLGGSTGMITSITDTTPLNAGALNYAITVGTVGTTLGVNKICQMHFQLYYAGYDSDCVNDGLGADAEILFTISNTKTAVIPTP